MEYSNVLAMVADRVVQQISTGAVDWVRRRRDVAARRLPNARFFESLEDRLLLSASPLEVNGVYVSSTSWSPSFINYLTTSGLGNANGYKVPTGASQLNDLPWTNLNQVSITFSENVPNISSAALALVGVNQASYATSGFAYNSTTDTATWTLPSAVSADKLIVSLNSLALSDGSGNTLDGSWTNGSSSYPSGASQAGTDFDFRINVVPGDVNQLGTADSNDIDAIRGQIGATNQAFADLNGSGTVNGTDLALARIAAGSANTLPAANPATPMNSVLASAKSATENDLSWGLVSGASGYNIYRGTSSGGENYSAPLNGGTPISGSSFADTTAVSGIQYFYTVKPIISGTPGQASAQAVATDTWANVSGHNNWTDPAAWVGGVAPQATTTVTFPSSASIVNPNIAGNTSANGISFDDSGADYSLTQSGGTWNLTVAAAGMTLTNTSGSAASTTINPNIILSAAQSFTATDSSALATLVFAGAISGNYALTISGNGMLTFQGANTFTGATSINSGIVNYQNGTALGTYSVITVASGATLQVQGGIAGGSQALRISGSGASGTTGALENVSGSNSYAGLVTLGAAGTISSDTGSLSLSNGGTISGTGYALTIAGAGNLSISSIVGTGSGTLTKNGGGTLTLAGANTYTGATTVNYGTLLLTGSTASGTTITVNSGGTLAGSGTISGSVSVASGGTIQAGTPGGATGILTITGNMTLVSGANFNVVLNGDTAGSGYDQVAMTGTPTLGSATLNLSGTRTANYSKQLSVIQNNGTHSISGTFLNLAAYAPTTSNGVNYNINYQAGTGSRSAILLDTSSGELTDTSPWGIGTSAEASGAFPQWGPIMATAGTDWVRNFPGWTSIEPSLNTWSWSGQSGVNGVIYTAALNGEKISALFGYNSAWATDSYPTGATELAQWGTYVNQTVAHCAGSIEYWEVWNEPEAFGNVPASAYASIVSTTYTNAKAADPNAMIGMTINDTDVNYFEQTITALKSAGAGNDFDYICVHPYSILDNLPSTSDPGYEAAYMDIVGKIRKMLAADDPSKVNVPIWITEENIGATAGNSAQLAVQGQIVTKGYTMDIAQGIAVTEFFEAQNSNYSMGLLTSSRAKNPGFYALQHLYTELGVSPQYQGWVQLHANQDYGFVFQGASTSVMVLWTMAGVTENVSFSTDVQVVSDPNASTLTVTALTAGQTLALTNAPVYILNVPADVMAQAQADKSQPFPWGGNYSGATTISTTAGEPNSDSGLHWMGADGSTTYVGLIAGLPARDCSQSAGPAFTIDPNFLSYTPVSVTISVTVYGKSGNPGFNLHYDSTSGNLASGRGWNSVPLGTWTTLSWTVTDDEFNNDWGYCFDFSSDSTAYSTYYINNVTVTINGDKQVSLASSFNNAGDFTDGQTFSSNGGFDGAGDAYSATAMGGNVTNMGTTFGFGTVNGNNVVNANGQWIALTSGKYSALTFLGAATGGTQSGTFTVNYTDGTHQTFTQGMSDWLSGSSAAGELVAGTMGYYNKYDGSSPAYTTYLYQYTFEIDASKTVSSVVLPTNTNIHILAMDLRP